MILKSCLPALSLLMLLATPPAPAALYKCRQDGAVTYVDQPCADAAELKPTPLPTVPALRSASPAEKPAPVHKPKLSRTPAAVEKSRKKTCDKLELHRRWAEQDVRDARAKPLRPQDKALENAQRKLRRAEELYRLECATPP